MIRYGERLSAQLFKCSVVTSSSLRHQSNDLHHTYLTNPTVVQPAGVDSLFRVRTDQQAWLNDEQWAGYSDSYLSRFMTYGSSQEAYVRQELTLHKVTREGCLRRVYDLYGTIADKLQKLHEDPLNPRFHDWMRDIKEKKEAIAAELDKVYPTLHPTVKLMYDAYLVRRYFHLGDWIQHVEKKRAAIFERMSPEFLAQAAKGRGLAEHYIERLEALGRVMGAHPELGIPLPQDYSEDELAMIRQKAGYFRSTRRYGANMDSSDRLA